MTNEEKLQQEINFMYEKYEELCKSFKKMMNNFNDNSVDMSEDNYKKTFY